MTKLASLIPPPGTNKYELAIVAAREARRLNDWTRRSGEIITGKVTARNFGRLSAGSTANSWQPARSTRGSPKRLSPNWNHCAPPAPENPACSTC